jgi:dTDP-4-amino-4,6-dideoxygalactose transaminase
LALLAAGIQPGDEVITVPFIFYATVAAIGYVGATPVYVDIDPATFNIDSARIEAAITGKTRHFAGTSLWTVRGHGPDS